MENQVKQKVEQVERLRAQGIPQAEAIKQVGMSRDSYFKYRRENGLAQRPRNLSKAKRAVRKRGVSKKPESFTLTLPADDMPLIVLVGKSSDVQAALTLATRGLA